MDGPAGGRGKWSRPGVPHRGWTCDDIEDLEEPSATCEMCETQEIRFVHYMSHPDYPAVLACGCDCAGHMEGDVAFAKARDKRMRSVARRRSHWPDRQGWHRSMKGNWTIRAQGFQITVFRTTSGAWRAAVARLGSQSPFYPRGDHDSVRSAKLAAFDKLVQLDKF